MAGHPQAARGPGSRLRAAAIGYQGFGNVGDEAILAGIEQILEGAGIDLEIIFCGDRAAVGAAPAARRVALRRLLPGPRSIAALRSMNVLLISGGGLINDYWAVVIPRYLAWSLLSRLMGTPVAWIGLGVGPVRRGLWRRLVAISAGLAELVTVRDEHSADWLRRCGIGRPIHVIPDPAFFVPPPPPAARAGLAIVLRPPLAGETSLADRMFTACAEAALADVRATGTTVSLVSMAGALDRPALDAVEALLRDAGVAARRVELGPDPNIAIAALGAFERVISVRLHGVIFAALAGTPVVPVAYDDKVMATAERLGLGTVAIPLVDIDASRLSGALRAVQAAAQQAIVADAVAGLRAEIDQVRALLRAVV